jgi:hypothetical protein
VRRGAGWLIDQYGRAQVVWGLLGIIGLSGIVTAVVHGVEHLSPPWLVLLGVSSFIVLTAATGTFLAVRGERPMSIVAGPHACWATPVGTSSSTVALTGVLYLTNPNRRSVQPIGVTLTRYRMRRFRRYKVTIKGHLTRMEGRQGAIEEEKTDFTPVFFEVDSHGFTTFDRVDTRITIVDQWGRHHKASPVFDRPPPSPADSPAETAQSFEVIDARYGTGDKSVDVTELVQALSTGGGLLFDVTNANLGGDPVPDQVKMLRLSYTVNWRCSVGQGVHRGIDRQAPLGRRILAPSLSLQWVETTGAHTR